MEGLVGTIRDEVGKKAASDLKGLAPTQGFGCPQVGDRVIEGGTGSDLGALRSYTSAAS